MKFALQQQWIKSEKMYTPILRLLDWKDEDMSFWGGREWEWEREINKLF